MEREPVIEKIKGLLAEKLENLKESLRQTESSVKQAPTAMESHSDTTRFQLGQLVDKLRALVKETESAVREIGSIKIFRVEKNNEIFYYVIFPVSLEKPFLIDEEEFRVISANAPIAKSLMDKKARGEITIDAPEGSYNLKIIGIY